MLFCIFIKNFKATKIEHATKVENSYYLLLINIILRVKLALKLFIKRTNKQYFQHIKRSSVGNSVYQ
jgi:hypothetical protein